MRYYFEREHLDMELEGVWIHPDMIVRFLDWCAKYIKDFEFVKFYDDFHEANKGGYSRQEFIDMLKQWGVFKNKKDKYKTYEMYKFLLYNRELYEHVVRNKRFDLKEISIRGLVNLYDLLNLLLLRFDDHEHYAPYVLHEMCLSVMWYGLKQLKLSYEKVKYGKILNRVHE